MASRWSFARTVQLGFELCGTYAIDKSLGRGFASSTRPLSSVARIGRFLDKAEGCYGAEKARGASRYLLDNSNSPMETPLAMLVCLPRTRGGENLSGFIMNKEFPLDPEWARRLGAHSFKPDLFEPNARVAIEYYGSDHDSATAKEYDASRQAIMEYLDIRVLGISKSQLYQPDKYMGTMKQLRKLLGIAYRKPTREQQIATLFLKDEILPGHDSSRYLGTFWDAR